MTEISFLIIVIVFFAVNMGASGIAPSFAAVYGAKLIKKSSSVLFFGLFVILGAICLGQNVALTLGKGLLPKGLLNFQAALIIIASASISLFLANILKIPQSTSQVTVGAITGAGLYFKELYTKLLFFKIIPTWIILPLASYLLTFLIYKQIYPPKHHNLHLYEKIFANEKKLKLLAIISSCYVAFAIGTNNVANAAGPLFAAQVLDVVPGLLMIAPLFGLGAWILGTGPLTTAGSEIVPLGLVSSVIVSFVTATLLIIASIFGIPQSLVQLNLCSIFAISSIKNGHSYTRDYHITRKTFLVWAITPLIATVISYILLSVCIRNTQGQHNVLSLPCTALKYVSL